MKLRLYLDTSVFSCLLDARTPERQAGTVLFWKRLQVFDVASSTLTREELVATPDAAKRKELLGLLEGLTLHAVTGEMKQLARAYVDHDVFTANVINDASHVAIAVMTNHNLLVSWNFKHLVNRTRRIKINAVNAALGLPPIEIVSPLEIQG